MSYLRRTNLGIVFRECLELWQSEDTRRVHLLGGVLLMACGVGVALTGLVYDLTRIHKLTNVFLICVALGWFGITTGGFLYRLSYLKPLVSKLRAAFDAEYQRTARRRISFSKIEKAEMELTYTRRRLIVGATIVWFMLIAGGMGVLGGFFLPLSSFGVRIGITVVGGVMMVPAIPELYFQRQYRLIRELTDRLGDILDLD